MSFGYDRQEAYELGARSASRLSDAQQDELKKTRIAETLPRTTLEVGAWIKICELVWVGSVAAPTWDGASQAESGVVQAGPRQAGGLYRELRELC